MTIVVPIRPPVLAPIEAPTGLGGGAPLVAPVNTVAPVASGTRGVGLTLSCTDGTWTGSPTFTYQWQSNSVLGGDGSGGSWANIGSATAATFVETAATAPYAIRRVTTGTNAVGAVAANSNALAGLTPETILGAQDGGRFDDGSATFTGATWTDREGIGNLTQGTGSLQPPAGTAINGHATIAPDGASAGDLMTNAVAMTSRASVTGFGFWAAIRTRSGLPVEAAVQSDANLWSESGGFAGISITTTPRLFVFDASYKATAAGTMVDSTVYGIRAYYDGTNLHFKSTGTVDKTAASGAVDSLAGGLRAFAPYTGNNRFGGDVACKYFCKAAPTAQQIADMDAWIGAYCGSAP